MTPQALQTLLAAAAAASAAARWNEAVSLYRQAEAALPDAAGIKHNLALASFGGGDARTALACATAATRLDPALWQSRALIARIHRGEGRVSECAEAWRAVLGNPVGDATARLGLADIAMNEFGDPGEAAALVAPLATDPQHSADATLTTLMAQLYLGGDAAAVSRGLAQFSRRHLCQPLLPPRPLRQGRRRVGLISPLFSASPVYYLTFSTWRAVAEHHDIVLFNRGAGADWATEIFASLAKEQVNLAHVDAESAARQIAEAEIDVLFDLGGWADAAGLRILSAKPAGRMYKWVGGQSATTGLEMFDGWIGDVWQSPLACQPIYAERIVNIEGGYADYTPPPALARLAGTPKHGVGLVGNPAKIGAGTIAAWPEGVDSVTLIDRRYKHPRALDRVRALLDRTNVRVERVVVPVGHEEYLRELAGCAAIVNTQPYAAGLTAVEAHGLGVRLLTAGDAGPLFASRHHLSHLRTGGRNPSLPAQILALIAS